jgi:RND family efflux transporter MFP subunit
MELVTQMPETIVAKARQRDIEDEGGKNIDFFSQFPSLPGLRIPAEISEIAAQADPVTRTYSVTFRLKQPENGRILAGMTGEITVRIPSLSLQGYPVPVSAVFTTPSGSHAVWKLDTTTMMPEETGVEVGEMMDDNIMILSGLSEGDTVITAGANFLSESQKVRIITDELRERR